MATTTTPAERAILDTIVERLLVTDPEASVVFEGGWTQNQDWVMSGDFTIRIAAERLWLMRNGLHFGSWELDQAGELALFVAVLSTEAVNADDEMFAV